MKLNNHTILVVEDDPNDILLLERAFEKTRLSNPCHIVRDGEEAITYLSGQGRFADRGRYPLPGLLLLDLKMPRKTGFEVLGWLRAQPGLRRIPTVVMTSSNQISDINRAYDLGANSYVVKPGGFDQLLEVVRSLEVHWLTLNEQPEVIVLEVQAGRG